MKKPRAAIGPRKVGYARVSTDEQNLAVQIEALTNYGVQKSDLHVEKLSATSKRRPAFRWALDTLRPGDEFVVLSLDRLGRDLLETIKSLHVIRESGAKFRSLTQGEINDETPFGRLMLFIQAALAQYESEKVVERTVRGIATAKRAGVVFGQAPKLSADRREACRKWAAKGMTVREIQAAVLKRGWAKRISYTTIHNYLRKDE